MKRFIAALLVSSMLMMTACSASEKNVESSGPETETSVEETTTEETTTTEEETTTEETKADDVFVPLFPSGRGAELSKVEPEALIDFNQYIYFLPVHKTDFDYDNTKAFYQLTSNNSTFDLCGSPEYKETDKISTVEGMYFYSNFGKLFVYFKIGGKVYSLSGFAPLFYNETKKCLAGYAKRGDEGFGMVEVYFSSGDFFYGRKDKVSNYTFTSDNSQPETTEPSEPGAKDNIVPLYNSKLESDVKSAKPSELGEYDKYAKLFPLVPNTKKKVYSTTSVRNKLKAGKDFKISSAPSLEKKATYTTEVLFFKEFQIVTLYTKTNGATYRIQGFAPMFYNKTKGCLAGYSYVSNNFVEMYYSPDNAGLVGKPASASDYGL